MILYIIQLYSLNLPNHLSNMQNCRLSIELTLYSIHIIHSILFLYEFVKNIPVELVFDHFRSMDSTIIKVYHHFNLVLKHIDPQYLMVSVERLIWLNLYYYRSNRIHRSQSDSHKQSAFVLLAFYHR